MKTNREFRTDRIHKMILIGLAIMAVSFSARAKTDTTKSIEQLEVNADNSEFNFKQYQDNLDIVNKNIDQSDKAIKDLRQMKSQLIKNTKNVDANKKALVKMEQDVQVMKKAEQVKLQKDEAQIAEVKKFLAGLEENKKKREENMLAYDKMLEQAKQEQIDWELQVKQMSTLMSDLETKEKKATEEKQSWTAKRRDYEGEAKKWEAQAANSRATYNKYKKLKD